MVSRPKLTMDHPPGGPFALDIRPRLRISCRAKPNSRLVAGGRGTQVVGANRAWLRGTQALSASARQLTPQADERGKSVVLPAGVRPRHHDIVIARPSRFCAGAE